MMQMELSWRFILIFSLSFDLSYAASETELGEWLFKDYSRNRRPRFNASDPVEVSLGIFIYNINEIVS